MQQLFPIGGDRVRELLPASVSAQAVRGWVTGGKLPACRIGGRWFVSLEDVREFIAGGRVEAAEVASIG